MKIKYISAITSMAMVCSVLLSTASPVFATGYYYSDKTYEVTITNITKGESFTPILAASHSKSLSLFEVGQASSEELATIAESGNIAPLKSILDGSELVKNTVATAGLLLPGQSVSFDISANSYAARFSFAAMLIPTNDTFVAIDSILLPYYGTATYYAKAYDAGSETNNELCVNIPGPACGGEGLSPNDLGEGYVYLSPGIHGEADLKRSAYDWQGAVAKVEVRRVYQ